MDSDSDANHLILGGGGGDDEETASLDDIEGSFNVNLRSVHQHDPRATELEGSGEYREDTTDEESTDEESTDEELERLGEKFHPLYLREGAHDEGMTAFLSDNRIVASGIRSMVPFLQNANNLKQLFLNNNDIQSEGFNVLLRALRGSSIETLSCNNCGIESIEIVNDYFPKHLKSLSLYGNNISVDGQIMLLKLVNDVSSIKATLQSNHTLRYLHVEGFNEEIQTHIDTATQINSNRPESVGREKVIRTQLNSVKRAALAKLQGVNRSLYSDIDPLHLPEVLALVGRTYEQGELHAAVSSSIMSLFSTVDRKKCMQQERKYHEAKAAEHSAIVSKHAAIVAEHKAKLEELDDELGAIEAAEGDEGNNEIKHRSNK